MAYTLTIEPSGREIAVDAGQTLLEALQDAGVSIAADCGGQGLCHHCAVLLLGGEVERVNPNRWVERSENGHRWILACQARPAGDLKIGLSPQSMAGDIAASGSMESCRQRLREETECSPEPLVRRIEVQLPPPTRDDTTADWQRLERGLTEADPQLPPVTAGPEVLQALPQVLRGSQFNIAATIADHGAFREIIDLSGAEPGDQPVPGIAVDIGTSTVVVQVVDLESGHLLGQAAGTNAQKAYGADVISRIIWAEEHPDRPAQMQRLIIDQIGELVQQACELSACDPSSILAASIGGNATMITFALGAYPGPIRRDPHIPMARDLPVLHARDLGLSLHPRAPVFFAPSVSGFVGGDISAGVLATGMAEGPELSLLVDVGTNGEIVLGNEDWLMCAACSAGPAFEGVDIAAGIHAVPGAIDRIEYDTEAREFRWQTIANQPPIGLCGTGLLEALATMFRGGILDRQGHLHPEHELVRQGPERREVVIVPKAQSGTHADIALNESEIENLIRSKAAVYAGISSLLNALALQGEDIQKLYIAGSFGNRLRVEEAVTIGLLPDVPRERIFFAGNTCLAGSYLTLMRGTNRQRIADIARKMTYLELSNQPRFMDEFISALFLPHTDLDRFPSQRKTDITVR